MRKPGAFAAYRYRDELFPTTTFRLADDRLRVTDVKGADRDDVRILHLAASTSETEVETARELVLEAGTAPTVVAVRDLVQVPTPQVPAIQVPPLDLSAYDQLIPSSRTRVSHDQSPQRPASAARTPQAGRHGSTLRRPGAARGQRGPLA